MRRRFLVSSVQRLLRDDERLVEVAFMWRHRPGLVASASVTAAAAYGATWALSFGSSGTRVGFALALALLVSVARTDYRVLALTTAPRFVLYRASRVRQVAVAEIEQFMPPLVIDLQGTNLVLTEWLVGGEMFTVPKSSQAAMTRLAGA